MAAGAVVDVVVAELVEPRPPPRLKPKLVLGASVVDGKAEEVPNNDLEAVSEALVV